MSELPPITGADGRQYKPVSCEQSRPFAAALLRHWQKRDRVDRIAAGWLNRSAINVPLEIYEAILPDVRADLARMKSNLDVRTKRAG